MQNEMMAVQLVNPTNNGLCGGSNAVIRGLVCMSVAVVASAVMCCRPCKNEASLKQMSNM